MTRIAILDDYQNVALDLADWNGLAGGLYRHRICFAPN